MLTAVTLYTIKKQFEIKGKVNKRTLITRRHYRINITTHNKYHKRNYLFFKQLMI